jgi:DNA-nicking Smr family endonuclease
MAGLKDFADLKILSKQLKEQGEARAAAEAERIKKEKQAVAEANIFRGSLGGITKLPESDRYVYQAPKTVGALPEKRKGPLNAADQAADDAAVLRESLLSDQFEVDHYMEYDPALNYLAPGVGNDVMKRLRKGYWPVQDELDLHGMRRDDARNALDAFLRRANQRGQRCVVVIHGRGLGSRGQEPVLKSMVHSWLVQTDGVIAFSQANAADGGEGALLILLRAALRIER